MSVVQTDLPACSPRLIEDCLTELRAHFPVVAVLGTCQVGKSTLGLHALGPNVKPTVFDRLQDVGGALGTFVRLLEREEALSSAEAATPHRWRALVASVMIDTLPFLERKIETVRLFASEAMAPHLAAKLTSTGCAP